MSAAARDPAAPPRAAEAPVEPPRWIRVADRALLRSGAVDRDPDRTRLLALSLLGGGAAAGAGPLPLAALAGAAAGAAAHLALAALERRFGARRREPPGPAAEEAP